MSERWKPGLNEVFWYINSGNKIDYTTNNGFGIDKEKIAAGNCFFTQAEAQAAAEKVKALLLSLPDNGNNLVSNLPDKKLPKLTAEVFNRPDCPEWAKYAVVDADGDGFYYKDKPRTCEADGEWLVDKCIVGTIRIITGDFDPTDWQNSLIERPVVLPDWCKVGEWIYIPTIGEYMQIKKVEDDLLFDKEGDHIPYTRCTQARPRPYNADEMKALVGKVINVNNGSAGLCTAYSAAINKIKFDDESWTPEELMGDQFSIDGKPCFVLEHLENGKWVE